MIFHFDGQDRKLEHMNDVVITGASRGIGRAVALALVDQGHRLILVARDEAALSRTAGEIGALGGSAVVVPGDLGSLSGAKKLADALAEVIRADVTLVHNAGLWPTRNEVTADGFERSFVINHLAPLVLQRALIESVPVKRVMAVSAGLIAMGRFRGEATTTGADFSRLRTYCNTKLAFAIATRAEAARYRDIDFLALHPGVVRTELGVDTGLLSTLTRWSKRFFEAPEITGARLARVLARPRWSEPGSARWLFEETEKPWPKTASNQTTVARVRDETARAIGVELAPFVAA